MMTAENKIEISKVILAGVDLSENDFEDSFAELQELAKTAGGDILASVTQKRHSIDKNYIFGAGKLAEIKELISNKSADLVIFNNNLSPSQITNLEKVLDCRVIDRTMLILDIFAARANTREGKLQVEIAQLNYRSQRLLGQGLVLSRLAGGIGTRGPGESKLEVSRRRIRERLNDLTRELEQVERQRGLRRQSRERGGVPVVALVGYTNAGKSTLFNFLTGSDVYVENQLFATLDSVSRPVTLPRGAKALLVDTVGFIRKLPHELVKAFRATLEEAKLADVLVIVSDGADPEAACHRQTVLEVLDSLGATQSKRIEVTNKADLLSPGADSQGFAISARTGENVDALLEAIESALNQDAQEVLLLIPFASYGLLNRLRGLGSVLQQRHADDGVRVRICLKTKDISFALRQGAVLLKE